jgi:hypothetical protein
VGVSDHWNHEPSVTHVIESFWIDALPAHFRSASSLQRATSKTTPLGTTLASTTQRASKLPADEKIEPYSIEARRIGRSLAFKALGLGTLACLIVNGIAAWGIGRYLGVRNVSRKGSRVMSMYMRISHEQLLM